MDSFLPKVSIADSWNENASLLPENPLQEVSDVEARDIYGWEWEQDSYGAAGPTYKDDLYANWNLLDDYLTNSGSSFDTQMGYISLFLVGV
jgi:hypothetical protein